MGGVMEDVGAGRARVCRLSPQARRQSQLMDPPIKSGGGDGGVVEARKCNMQLATPDNGARTRDEYIGAGH